MVCQEIFYIFNNTVQPMGEILKAYFNIFIYRKTTMENSDLLGPPPRLGLELGTS